MIDSDAPEPEPPDASYREPSLSADAFDARVSSCEMKTTPTPGSLENLGALEGLCRLAVHVLDGEGVSRGHVDLHLVDTATITELNLEHMGSTGSTDVLAFPLVDDEADPFAPVMDLFIERDSEQAGNAKLDPRPVTDAKAAAMLGDIVLCPAVAEAQAGEHTGRIDAEYALLVIHGVLHLLGHDHAEPLETALMQTRERYYLTELGFTHPVEPAT